MDLIKIDQEFKLLEKKIKVVGTVENPWFCGKDFAELLDYIDCNDAIRSHVSLKNKKSLGEIINISGEGNLPSPLKLNKNDMKAIYITEPGVYQLIFKSKKQEAEQIQDWVFEEVLPSIRKTGSYQLNKQLEEKEKLLLETKSAIEEKQKELEEKEKALQIAESKNLQLTTQIKESEQINPDGWIYIATTKQYSQNNQYKLGKTKTLNPRMQSYQTGRAKGDSYYYVYVFQTAKMDLLESLLKGFLHKYKDVKTKEIFVLPWKLLYEYVEYICSNFNECFIFELNKLIIDNLEFDFSKNEIPEPWDFSKALIEQDEALDDGESDDESDVDDVVGGVENDAESESSPTEEETVDSGFVSEEETPIKAEESKSSSKIAKSSKKVRCRPCGNSYYQDEFDLLPDGKYCSMCKICVKKRLDGLVNEILYTFDRIKRTKSFLQSKNIKANRIRMNEIVHELKQLPNISIYKKKTITETHSFKRCGHEHSNEFERWLPKSKFSISAGKIKSNCKDCFNASERKRYNK